MGETAGTAVNEYVIFDLEATSADPAEAEIVEIAALIPGGETFHRYVRTQGEYLADHAVWSITKIDPDKHRAEQQPLDIVLRDFLAELGDSPLAGHNIERYDLPLIRRHLEALHLALPESPLPPLDTLRWAHLRYPTPPKHLRGYRLGDLYEFFTGSALADAHQAINDCVANLEVLKRLLADRPPEAVLKVWAWLGLPEAGWYGASVPDKDELKQALTTLALVDWVNTPGQPFPSHQQLFSSTNNLLKSRRPSQEQMMGLVEGALDHGHQVMIQAPTGTGKTKGYLYPAHAHLSQSPSAQIIVGTHTKVLQQQALKELRDSSNAGYETRAVSVKSPRDYICPDALLEAVLDLEESTPEQRVAQGVLAHYAHLGQFDLGALPYYWDQQASFREVRFAVQTNPNRCRPECPFIRQCAYQTDRRQRQEATFWVTNQAWLLAHYGNQEPDDDVVPRTPLHLIIDEAHNLEEVATGAFSQTFGEEESRLHLLRIYNPQKRRGWLRDNRYVPEHLHDLAQQIRLQFIPKALDRLKKYSVKLTDFLKQYGQGEKQFGLSLTLGPAIRKKSEWPKVRIAEDEWIGALRELRVAVQQFPGDSYLERNLRSSMDYFRKQMDLLYQRRAALRENADEEADSNLIYLSQWHENQGWSHVAQPVDISEKLKTVWQHAASLTLTSATLAIAGEFDYMRRVLGLEEAQTHELEATLPYDKAHLVIPSHLPEARSSSMRRFQSFLHRELETLIPLAGRSLSLFTSSQRMRDAGKYLEKQPDLYLPLTRREREDVAQIMGERGRKAAALGTRAYMEGVDFPDLKVVNLERIPFPVPTPLLQKRQELAERKYGLDPWQHVFLPKALLSFVQAFGRLIRDDRKRANQGAFVLWDKRLLNASYQELFFRALPKGVLRATPQNRKEFYSLLGAVLDVAAETLPQEELRDETLEQLESIRRGEGGPEEKAERLAKTFWKGIDTTGDKWAKQLQAIQADLQGQDLLVLLPTGFGKSLTFQVPAFLQDGVTLVISPLIALMRDQVEKLQEQGLPAAALHSMLSGAEQRSILSDVRDGLVSLLYLSPERVRRSQELRNLVRDLARDKKLRRLVLDEAHCLSDWGHDFRPDYLRVKEDLTEWVGHLPTSALTATATPKVIADLKERLSLRDPVEVSASYDRPNLSYYSYKLNDVGKLQRLTQILGYLKPEDSAIIYASTQKQVERLAWALNQLGFQAGAYHAGFSAIIRTEVQDRFASGEVPIMVATNAFGLGVDKGNVRVVIHFNPPMNLPAYIQEAGRGGRDGQPAYAVLLHNRSDWNLADFIAGIKGIRSHHATALMEVLGEPGHWSGYAAKLVEAINEQLVESQIALAPEHLVQLLSSIEESGVLEFEYRVGKVFVLCPDTQILPPGGLLETLEGLGFKGSITGDVLDFSVLNMDQAENLNQHLYSLWKERKIAVYSNREPVLEVKRVGWSLHRFERRQSELRQSYRERLEEMQQYADTNHCKRSFLLRAFEQQTLECNSCQSCTGNDAPWEEAKQFEVVDLEMVYKPLDTLLEFLSAHRLHAHTQADYAGIGETKIVMALQGEEHSFDSNKHPFKLGRREVENPYFGHLSFVRENEIKRALQEALRKGFVQATPYMESATYRINDAGVEYLNRPRRKERQWQTT